MARGAAFARAGTEGTTVIQLQGIGKVFPASGQEVTALRDVDLTIGDGEIFGIIGLSGAGKSTLLRMINGLERPTTGKVLLDGQDVHQLKPPQLRALRRQVGMIFQNFNLLASRDVAGNVAFPLELEKRSPGEIRRRVAQMLELVGLQDKARAYPAQLSGGQKQRVAIARALANGPKVLLSDEATSALDPRTTQSILALLDQIHRQLALTIVLITHEMEVIRQICHKVAILEAGRLVEQGTVKDIFMNPRSPTAREFLSNLPRTGMTLEGLPKSPGCPLAVLFFDGTAAGEPVISQVIRRCGVDINILAGDIDRICSDQVGNLTVQFLGDSQGIAQALDQIRGNGVKVEVIWNG